MYRTYFCRGARSRDQSENPGITTKDHKFAKSEFARPKGAVVKRRSRPRMVVIHPLQSDESGC